MFLPIGSGIFLIVLNCRNGRVAVPSLRLHSMVPQVPGAPRVGTLPDRRIEPRFESPTCESCGNRETVIGVTRTRYVLYIRCPECGYLWS